ncbi:unnamed protein product [Echinostoma caproni]|uniref:CRAL_TRIO_N domain-containing protein n=1 Tax=Echinostoma caproni TaxID=27848 RepID=A0A183AI81_9TREM|nr:unnamed protein product [Echinostoma caproni]
MAADPQMVLSKLYIDKARKELHEEPEHVAAHIQSLKRCIAGMPHLKCPQDDRFYLTFLRQAKYQHSRAQSRIDNFITLRCSENQATSAWFDRSMLTPSLVDQYLKLGYVVFMMCIAGRLHIRGGIMVFVLHRKNCVSESNHSLEMCF